MNRLDRGMYTQPLWVGFFLTGIYVMTVPHTSRVFPATMEFSLGFLFSVFALLCLVGSVLGTRWCYPDAKLRTSYRLEIVGLIGICLVLGIEAVQAGLSLVQQFTMAGSLGAIIQIGSIRFIVMLWLALRHLDATRDA